MSFVLRWLSLAEVSTGEGFIVGGVFAIALFPEMELIVDSCGETGS